MYAFSLLSGVRPDKDDLSRAEQRRSGVVLCRSLKSRAGEKAREFIEPDIRRPYQIPFTIDNAVFVFFNFRTNNKLLGLRVRLSAK